MARIDLSRKLSQKQPTKKVPTATVRQDWAKTGKSIETSASPKVKPSVEMTPTREVSTAKLAQQQEGTKGTPLRERIDATVKRELYRHHLQRNVLKVGSTAGLGINAKFEELEPTEGDGELEGYTLKSHFVPSVTREDKEAYQRRMRHLKRLRDHGAKVKPSKFAKKGGQRACGGSVYRPNP